MRTFIAIDIPREIKKRLVSYQETFKACRINAKWVNIDNSHLTLKFLGEVNEERIDIIKQIIDSSARLYDSFNVKLKSFGFFPDQKKPRVFFVSTDNEKGLKRLSLTLEEKLSDLGFAKEGKFKSHITLARFKSLDDLSCLINEIEKIVPEGNFSVDHISLYKSTLTSKGPIYDEIYRANLKG
ncbi:MAG: RNA 2',3'-cyclic phosphodiesterase [Candidatus Omnitrophota bacterium]